MTQRQVSVIVSPNSSSRNGAKVRLIAIHTAEGSLSTRSLGNYFAQTSSGVSSHLGVDANGVEQYVDFGRAAWTIRNANPISDNLELCGFAEMTRAQWLSEADVTFRSVALNRTVTVSRPAAMLRLAAAAVRERCLARGIPMVKLSPADVRAGKAGVIGHVDWTVAMRDGEHQDPGPGFPWPEFLAAVSGAPSTPAKPPTRHPQEDDVMYIKCQVPNGPLLTGLLSGSLLIGFGTKGELDSAAGAIAAGQPCQWVEKATWDALAARNRRPDDVTALGVKLDAILAQLRATTTN